MQCHLPYASHASRYLFWQIEIFHASSDGCVLTLHEAHHGPVVSVWFFCGPTDYVNNESVSHEPHSVSGSCFCSAVSAFGSGSVGECHVQHVPRYCYSTNVSVVPLEWLKPHPILREIPLKSAPRAVFALSVANGKPIY